MQFLDVLEPVDYKDYVPCKENSNEKIIVVGGSLYKYEEITASHDENNQQYTRACAREFRNDKEEYVRKIIKVNNKNTTNEYFFVYDENYYN